ncbi:MAG: peptidase S10 [Planctomycetaceae bacterium]
MSGWWKTMFSCGLVATSSCALFADEKPPSAAVLEGGVEAVAPNPETFSVTQHQATISGKPLTYQVTAGSLPLTTDNGKNTAQVFFVAYTRTDTKHGPTRPISYCFNGGPGSSSVWLHLGMLAPVRVLLGEQPLPVAPPYRIGPNPFSMLDKTDLVFIDPVSTGYSRPASAEDGKQFYGYEQDIQSVGQFIHLYTTRFNRWQSPRFLIGESYGCMRAAGLSKHLQDRYRMELNGIVLVSSVINFQTIRFGVGNDLPHILFLPTYTATAWYHKRLSPELQKSLPAALAAAEEFALGDYTVALMRGTELKPRERQRIAREVARFTGLSPTFVQRSNLRIRMSQFAKELLRKRNRTVGRFDSRYLGLDRDGVGDSYDYDPSGAAIFGPFTAALYQYLRNDLKVEQNVPYEILTSKVHPWSYENFENRYVDASESLRQSMTRNPHLKVFVANGRFDLATPYLATRYSFNHMLLAPELRDNVTMSDFDAGHMMYIHEPSLERLKRDLDTFYEAAAQPAKP